MTRAYIVSRVRERSSNPSLPTYHALARADIEAAGGKLATPDLVKKYGRGIVGELRRHYPVRICEWARSPSGGLVSVIALERGLDAPRPASMREKAYAELEAAGGKINAATLRSKYGSNIVAEMRKRYDIRVCDWCKRPTGGLESIIEIGEGKNVPLPRTPTARTRKEARPVTLHLNGFPLLYWQHSHIITYRGITYRGVTMEQFKANPPPPRETDHLILRMAEAGHEWKEIASAAGYATVRTVIGIARALGYTKSRRPAAAANSKVAPPLGNPSLRFPPINIFSQPVA